MENVKMKKERVDTISSYLWVQPIEINSSLVSWQNRKRLYRTNIPGVTIPEDKGILLKDVLEENVDNKYYLTDAQIETTGSWKDFEKTSNVDKMSNSIKLVSVVNWEMRIKQPTKQGYAVAEDGDGVNLRYPNSTTRRGRVIKGKSQTLTTQSEANVVVKTPCGTQLGNSKNFGNAYWNSKAYTLRAANPNGVIEGVGRIRKLTPIECERLQTLPDNYTEGVSENQRYKMLGNGRTVDVIKHIFSFIPNK